MWDRGKRSKQGLSHAVDVKKNKNKMREDGVRRTQTIKVRSGLEFICPAVVCAGPAAAGQARLDMGDLNRQDRGEARVAQRSSGQDSEGREVRGQKVLDGIRLQ